MGASVGGGRRRFGAGFADINVTPFVDVMLVLLIIFMVTAPLLATGLKIKLPDVQATEAPVKDAKLVISITKDEKVFISARGKEKDEEDITQTLESYFIKDERIQKEKELYIRADKDARYGIVARVVAAARRAGVNNLNLMVQPELQDDTEAEKPKK
ncbi:MAG: transporter [Polyangiaceae bacterium]|nr:transporter [Polyangiaceae bacterium]